jgi:hypothetical protein
MFEITGNDIAALNDEQLRALVARLCEAELRALGLPASAVTWGGNQDARDGGIDVRVKLPDTAAIDGFIPRPATGFQVKKPDTTPGAVAPEMAPGGTVRRAIQELAKASGAYIIVSSGTSASDSALHDRLRAMQTTVAGICGADKLHLDFYDRSRLATWVRTHPGLILWVREKIGRAIRGWRAYGPWAFAPEGPEGEYLLDDKVRIRTDKKEDGEGVAPLEGIRRVRDLLREPGRVGRLVGLSGVGKTRFVQALFDERVDQQSLDPSLAIYTNMADGPDPQPTGLASDLIAARIKAILVVDNCAPELHRSLSEICRSPGSTVSVITVEYDIREDEPEGTQVFSMEPSSLDLIAKLVARRYPAVSKVDANTIAGFSGGNARIAIALANTVGKNETIAGLSDEDLFRRLFYQRHEPDESLLLAAQACSLVYSFQGEDLSGADAELPRLAALIGKRAEEVFRCVAELRRRDLVQQRGVWRAVLPHAIANPLAAMALQNIPPGLIEAQLVTGAPDRLLRSFTRRLGYLHASREAVQVGEALLGRGGMLGDVAELSGFRIKMFENIAPVAPEAAMGALERIRDTANGYKGLAGRTNLIHLLRSLAYESVSFERCTGLLIAFAEAAEPDGKNDEAANTFESLFCLYLSGTRASVEQRLRVVEALLRSEQVSRFTLGVEALLAMLEAWHFSSIYPFEFGARPRDHGYWPKTVAEVRHWYSSVLKLVEAIGLSDLPVAIAVRKALAQKFRGLWYAAGVPDDAERVCRAIAAKTYWRDGWIAVRQSLQFEGDAMAPELRARLNVLEELLRPRDLVQKVRTVVLGYSAGTLDLEDLDDDEVDASTPRLERSDAIALRLGRDTAEDESAFAMLLPELVSGTGKLWQFGRGLALGSRDPQGTWSALVGQLAKTPEREQSVQVLCGLGSRALREWIPVSPVPKPAMRRQ